MQVAHLTYHTAYPHTPFNPYHFITPLDDSSDGSSGGSSSGSSGGGSRLAVALYGGDTVRFLHASVHRQAAQPPPSPGPQPSPPSLGAAEEGEEDSSTSNFASPDIEQPAARAAGAGAAEPALEPAGQRAPTQQPAAAPQGDSSQQQQQQQQQQHSTPQSSGWAAGSPLGSPWPRQGQRHRRRRPPPSSPSAEGPDSELGVQYALVSCTHTIGSVWHPPPAGTSGSSLSSSGSCCAAISVAAAPQHLDLEACVYAALRQQGLPAGDLLDYAAAPVQGCSWQGRDGLLLLAVLRLRRPQQPAGAAQQPGVAAQPLQPQLAGQQPAGQQPAAQQPAGQQPAPSRSACVLLHVAAGSGAAVAVEWLEPPYPWHADLAAYLVQQTALAGGLACSSREGRRGCGRGGQDMHAGPHTHSWTGSISARRLTPSHVPPPPAGLAFEKAPAFFADFMRSRWAAPPPRARLPLALSNRSVLGTGRSLAHVAHPWLPQAILGYGGGGGSSGGSG